VSTDAAIVLLVVLAGSIVYSLLSMVAAARYLSVRPPALASPEPISILKPLAGLDLDLESNLRTFFEQDYPAFEILFAVKDMSDPAAQVVEKLRKEYPEVPSQLLVTGEPPYPNAKVFSLDRMMAVAAHDLLVMSDSDIRVTPDLLRTVAAEFQNEGLGVATCPYRAVAGPSFWSHLEAIGMNTDFMAGILVARMLAGMQFAVGPTIVARKRVLASIGGFDRLKDYLAEDFVMGKFAAEVGHGVILSSYVIEHHIGSSDRLENTAHRLR
jgi:ceramide glucosyltransferase